MNIGFDAKRAYHNNTGLGHYSRTLITQLSENFPEHQYYLFNPKPSSRYKLQAPNIHEIRPGRFPHTFFTSNWRSRAVTKDLKKLGIDLYHGLSHEIPVGIGKTGIKSVVTIHDLIHERYPNQYKAIDRKIYTLKYRYACQHADKVIAISQQTRRDLIEYYKTPPEKIEVCYQSCSPVFGKEYNEETKKGIVTKYKLPPQFFLSVGTINERKNLLNICKALAIQDKDTDIPLIVVGNGSGEYYKKVKQFVSGNKLEKKIIFLSEMPETKTGKDYLFPEDLSIIYQLATGMIYPSFFEGFGIPVLEALWSRLPVITSNVSCLPEVGGDAAYYINPASVEELAEGMKKIYHDKQLTETMKNKGWLQAQHFAPRKCATAVMDLYKNLF